MADVSPDLDAVLDRQSRAWLTGDRPRVEELLNGSALGRDPEAQLDLIYNEIVLREELGEAPAADDYTTRYPHLRDELELHFEVHRAIRLPIPTETARLADVPTVIDLPDAALGSPAEPPGYELLQELGRGGMGVVSKARDRRLRRYVAVKMFQPGRLAGEREVRRFRAEAEAVARLQHPNIVQIFEVGEAGGLPFLALELAEGGTLAKRLQELPFAPRAAAELIETLARAIHHAHENGIIHRDLKPANVLFARDGTPKLTDFGLAKMLDDDSDASRDATRTGEPIGTPRYMAPEQAAGQADKVGPATDVYALGTLLYECLTGRAPFVAASVIDTMDKIRSEDPLPPRRLQRSVPRDLETICLHCLEKEPGKRYPTAAALADDLRRYLDGQPISARPTPSWERAYKWARRRPAHAVLVAVAVVLMVAGVSTALVFDYHERQRIAEARADVERLMTEGQEALARQDEDGAEARFREAWMIVQAEPALRDFQTGVAGWLDHSRRAANRERWKHRVPPREYDQQRDEAVFLGLLIDLPFGDPVAVGREAAAGALALTLPNDPAWRPERERLVLLDAALAHRQSGPAAALARLDAAGDLTTRLARSRRAAYLDELGRTDDAAADHRWAEQAPPDELASRFFAGTELARRGDFVRAAREFDAVLDAEPEHLAARLALAACDLKLGRTGEARVALTACIAQQPRLSWAYLLRARCAAASGDTAAAIKDLERGLDAEPPAPARFALLCELGSLRLRAGDLAAARDAWTKAAETLPNEPAGRANLARLAAAAPH